MQQQVCGGPLKSSDEMKNTGEKEGVVIGTGGSEREDTKPGDFRGEETIKR